MKCPKCGYDIKEGHLYCEKCGEEIRIVPDFDATTDEDLKISLTGVIDTDNVLKGLNKDSTREVVKDLEKETTKEIAVTKEISIGKESKEKNISKDSRKNSDIKDDKPNNKLIIKALVIAGAICAVFAIIGGIINKRVNDYYSVDKQYENAFDQFERGQYEDSVKTIKHAINIDAEDARLKMLLADNYYMLGKYDESNAVLFDLLEIYKEDTGILDKIIQNYQAQGDTQAINKLLSDTGDTKLAEPYVDYLAQDVKFSYPEGSYDEILNLELTSNEGSTIYYTIDGSEVTTSSPMYTAPIVLETGEYTVNAMAVNSKGVQSNITTAKYTVDYYKPDMPVIKTGTGKYNTPKPVEVEISDFDTCYYTVDGEDPTLEDERYVGPLAMYIGKHTYKFAVISDKGVSSDVVSVEITLDLITLIDMESATNNLVAWINATGRGSDDRSYVCEQAYETNGSIYYIINEYTKTDSDGEKLTGNHYAVDVLTGLTYRAVHDRASGKYTLEVLI